MAKIFNFLAEEVETIFPLGRHCDNKELANELVAAVKSKEKVKILGAIKSLNDFYAKQREFGNPDYKFWGDVEAERKTMELYLQLVIDCNKESFKLFQTSLEKLLSLSQDAQHWMFLAAVRRGGIRDRSFAFEVKDKRRKLEELIEKIEGLIKRLTPSPV